MRTDKHVAGIASAGRPGRRADIASARVERRRRVAHRALLVVVGGLGGLVVLRALAYAIQLKDVLDLLTWSDHRVFMEAAARLRGDGPLYREFQLAGPYSVRHYTASTMVDLNPPTTYVLVTAMSFLPDVLWWVIPLSVLAAMVWCWRPSLTGWAVILACFAPPWAWDAIVSGGMIMWVAAFIALGTRWPFFFAGVLVKPSLFPFALLGIRSPLWWVAVIAGGFVAVLTLPLWIEYAKAITNLSDAGLLYSIHDVPFALVPLIAWATRTRLRSASHEQPTIDAAAPA